MKITIVTVCLNSDQTIEDTIKSVLMQTYDDIEYIIVDGGSTDGTLSIIERYLDKISQYVSEPDKGLYDAMNKGIKLGTGELIAFLNSDDAYQDKNIITDMVNFIKRRKLGAGYGDVKYVDKDDSNRVVRYWQTGVYRKGSFRRGWVIPHPAFFCRREYFERYGYFESSFKIAADFEFMLRILEKQHIKVGYLPKIIATMRIGGASTNLRGIVRGNVEILKSFRINNMYCSPWFFLYKPLLKLRQLIFRKVEIRKPQRESDG